MLLSLRDSRLAKANDIIEVYVTNAKYGLEEVIKYLNCLNLAKG